MIVLRAIIRHNPLILQLAVSSQVNQEGCIETGPLTVDGFGRYLKIQKSDESLGENMCGRLAALYNGLCRLKHCKKGPGWQTPVAIPIVVMQLRLC